MDGNRHDARITTTDCDAGRPDTLAVRAAVTRLIIVPAYVPGGGRDAAASCPLSAAISRTSSGRPNVRRTFRQRRGIAMCWNGSGFLRWCVGRATAAPRMLGPV